MFADAFFERESDMVKLKLLVNYFTKTEIVLWFISVFMIITSFCVFDGESYATLTASLIGVTSLILCAKGNPFGLILMIIFSVIYGAISFGFAYYGEMATYIGMTLPMSVVALVAWLKNPYNESGSEVKVNCIDKRDVILMLVITLFVTAVFYFILEFFNTANLVPSTISVATSFIAAYLSFRRSPYFAAAYAANDIVLIVLWVLASVQDIKYISVVVCFAAFLANDIYGFGSWKKMEKRQNRDNIS